MEGFHNFLCQAGTWKLIYCSRTLNVAAHKLASIGFSLDTDVY